MGESTKGAATRRPRKPRVAMAPERAAELRAESDAAMAEALSHRQVDPYEAFLHAKSPAVRPSGLAQVPELHPALFHFQRSIVAWALRHGRAALFADTGLGKTLMSLSWAQHVPGRVLILAPLAVAQQTAREAARWGIDAVYEKEPAGASKIVVTNYERLERFEARGFGGVVIDESSCLKAYTGSRKRQICEAFSDTPFRLACTATPAPNDHLELGNHSEFLGVLSSHEMIARWFVNDQSAFGTYRLKGHAVDHFWDWVTSWARCVGKPSDLGDYDDALYNLPPLRLVKHMADVDVVESRVMRPGRVACIDCKDLVDYAGSAETGMAGLRDFPGNLVRIYKAAGFSWHSRVTLWRNPVTEMQKTKAHGLLYKQLRADSTFSRMGLPMYVLMFRKWAPPGVVRGMKVVRWEPLPAMPDAVPAPDVVPVTHTAASFQLNQWQEWASPVWMDIDYTNVLNVRTAREDKDEKHLAPMPLGAIERCVGLYSNPGEVVLDPFTGVGSVGYVALKAGRRFVGAELKESYYRQSCANLREAETVEQLDLLAGAGA